MALYHPRILFPEPNATLCITECNEACQFYQYCSPSPPDSPLPVNSTPDSTPIQLHHASTLLPNLLIAAASLVAAAFLLLAAFYAILRFRRLNHDPPSAAADDGDGEGDGDGDLFELGETDVHHVWYIRTVGLDEPTIHSIAAWAYKAGDGLLGAADEGCTVCLAEFRDGELLRLLPKCGHAFHLPCIDTWLRSHVNCPICRAPIVAPPTAAASDPVELHTGSSALVEDAQIAVRPPEADRMEPEEETESGGVTEIGIAIDPATVSSYPSPSSLIRVPIDLEEDRLQPVRRSVSMDSSSLGALLLLKGDPVEGSGEEKKDTDLEEGSTAKNRGKMRNALKGAARPKDPQEMERSLSSSGGRFLLSRHGRGWSAVLPL